MLCANRACYRSSAVDSERYFLACSRYIELNPVRAHMVDEPEGYRWSSYHHNALGGPDPLITPHALYEELGSGPADRQAAYRALFADPLATQTLRAIRGDTRTRGLVGDDEFRALVEAKIHRSLARPLRGGDRRSAAYQSLKDARLTSLGCLQTTLTP